MGDFVWSMFNGGLLYGVCLMGDFVWSMFNGGLCICLEYV